MSKIKLLTISVIGLMIVNLGMVAFLLMQKHPFRPDGRPPMEQKGPKAIIIDRLHFDKEQTVQYEHLIEEHQTAIKSLNDSIKTVKNNLYQSLSNENDSVKDSLITTLGLLHKQIELTHYEHFAAIKKLCKPDQLEYYNSLTKELAQFFADKKTNNPPRNNNAPEGSFKQLDTYKDGKLSNEEVKVPVTGDVAKVDSKKDGSTLKEEPGKKPGPQGQQPPAQTEQQGPPPGGQPSVEEIFAQMDANKDGKISKEEARGPLQNDFVKIDTNKDGFISKEELEKAPKPNREGGPQGGGRPQGPPPGGN